MKAYGITARDTQPALHELHQPRPGPGEVLLEVEAASVNGFDLSVAAGYVMTCCPTSSRRPRPRPGRHRHRGRRRQRPGGRGVAGVIPGVPRAPPARRPRRPGLHGVTPVPAGSPDAAGSGWPARRPRRARASTSSPKPCWSPAPPAGSAPSPCSSPWPPAPPLSAPPAPARKGLRPRPGRRPHRRPHRRAARWDHPRRRRQGAALRGDAATIGQLLRPGGAVATTLGATAEQVGGDDVTVAGIMAAPAGYGM